MEINGKVKKMLPAQSGTSQRTGERWMSQEFVLDYFWWSNQQLPSQMVLKVFGEDRIKQYDLHENDEVKVRYHIEAREYNERWYNEVRCDNVEKIGASAQQKPAVNTTGTVETGAEEAGNTDGRCNTATDGTNGGQQGTNSGQQVTNGGQQVTNGGQQVTNGWQEKDDLPF